MIKKCFKKYFIEICILILLIANLFFVTKGVNKMADVIIPSVEKAEDFRQLKEILMAQQKQIEFLMGNLDSKNVRQINTNVTNVKSADGSTKIDGNTLVMTDTSQPRLRMGYNKDTGLFEFIIYDENGIKTFEVDSTGEAVFKGSITTSKDAYVGNNLYVGDPNAVNVDKQIQLNANAYFATQSGNVVFGNFLSGGDLTIHADDDITLSHDAIGFYGQPPVQRQVLSSNPTNAAIAAVLFNLGLTQ